MLDFTSSHYLGFGHASRLLHPWMQLTTGVPAALREQDDVTRITVALAKLQGLGRATLARSTLHLFWDLFGMLPSHKYCIYIDAQAYPTAQWGAERAAGRGVIVKSFPHRKVKSLGDLLRQQKRQLCPVIVTDGFCPYCGSTAPLRAYQEYTQESGGLLVIDDTQALGILGQSPSQFSPYGLGGGGSLRYLDLSGDRILVICSLAKAFGVPIASLSGSETLIQHYELLSSTRVHCSPPSQADLAAAEHALGMNKTQGEFIRKELVKRVCLFRKVLADARFGTRGGLFPVQTLESTKKLDPELIYHRLLEHDIQAVLHKYPDYRTSLSFIITAHHSPEDIKAVAQTLCDVLQDESVTRERG